MPHIPGHPAPVKTKTFIEQERERLRKTGSSFVGGDSGIPKLPLTKLGEQTALLPSPAPAPGTVTTAVPPTATTPIAPAAAPPAVIPAPTGTLAEQAGAAAQTAALEAPDTTLTDLASQRVQGLFAPAEDPQAARRLAQEQFARSAAQRLEVARQGLAGVAGSGERQQDLGQFGIQLAQQEADIGRQFDITEGEAQRQRTLDAINQAIAVSGEQGGQASQRIQDLIAASTGELERGFEETQQQKVFDQQTFLQSSDQDFQSGLNDSKQAFLGEQAGLDRAQQLAVQSGDQAFQTNLQTLRNAFESGQLLKSQDFAATQNDLDRKLQEAIQSGDQQQQLTIIGMQQDFQNQQAVAEREFAAAQNVANNEWKTGERLDQNQFDSWERVLDRDFADAQQANDIEAQTRIQESRNNLQLTLQTNGFSQDEKITFLNDELSNARANKDFDRQKELIGYSAELDFERILQSQGFQAAQSELDRSLQTALEEGDNIAAAELQRKGFEFQAKENAQNRLIEQSRLDLQERGIDVEELFATYNIIQDQVDTGVVGPDAALNFLNTSFEGLGLEPIDPDTAFNSAVDQMKRDYKLELKQFEITNPGFVKDGELTNDGVKEFNTIFNKAFLGTAGAPGEEKVTAKPGSTGPPIKPSETASNAIGTRRTDANGNEWVATTRTRKGVTWTLVP